MTELADAEIAFSNLQRVLWPLNGFTKGDVIAYYDRVSDWLLPHIRDRALTLGRFPGGVDRRGFAQTSCRGRPSWLLARAIRLRDGSIREYCVVTDRRSLLWVANQCAIELHPFLSRAAHEQPTDVVFDLDPGDGAGILQCREVALRLRDVLAELGLASFAKGTGSAGLHVQVPLNTPHTYTHTKAFARAVAKRLAGEDPARITDHRRRDQRAGRVLVDWLANDPSRSIVAPYSLRATDLPTVAMPLRWEELEGARSAGELWFLASDAIERLHARGDALAPALELRQRLPH